ncbi:hypothetical protein AV530_009156 [Patagioenas fasciata monilis]|uniref:Uncharacterized protein n=1 Tax=Patagioenas fasciata monilis TaxID=372326 RepID=A0A1V4IWC4_PATFA|nr:hypothetical protein AV530_009156 [Patagioenas fasciata monilis]
MRIHLTNLKVIPVAFPSSSEAKISVFQRSSFGDLQKDTACFSEELWRLKGSLEHLNMDPHAVPHAKYSLIDLALKVSDNTNGMLEINGCLALLVVHNVKHHSSFLTIRKILLEPFHLTLQFYDQHFLCTLAYKGNGLNNPYD